MEISFLFAVETSNKSSEKFKSIQKNIHNWLFGRISYIHLGIFGVSAKMCFEGESLILSSF